MFKQDQDQDQDRCYNTLLAENRQIAVSMVTKSSECDCGPDEPRAKRREREKREDSLHLTVNKVVTCKTPVQSFDFVPGCFFVSPMCS